LDGGHDVSVWNRSKGKADDVVAAGAQEAATVAGAVAGADAVITVLSNDEAVRTVALEELRQAIDADTVYIDASTVGPGTSTALAGAFDCFIAMPVLGSPGAVTSGQAVLLAGGDDALIDAMAPVLSSLSSKVRRYATPRLALTAKLTNNLMLLCEVVALAESFAVGRAGGLTDDQLRELLEDNPVTPAGVKNRFEAVLAAEGDSWWTTVLGAKDAALALGLAGEAGVELPLADTVREIHERAADSGLEDADIAAVAQLYRPTR
jgi:3-hydroxyisobutyrate dehydrogenase